MLAVPPGRRAHRRRRRAGGPGTRPVGVLRRRAQPHQPDDTQHVRRRLVGPAHRGLPRRRCGRRRPTSSAPPTSRASRRSVSTRSTSSEWLRDAPAKKPMYADPDEAEARPTASTAACPTSVCPKTRSTSWSPTCWSGSGSHHGADRTSCLRALVPAVATPSAHRTACSAARSRPPAGSRGCSRSTTRRSASCTASRRCSSSSSVASRRC